MIFGATGLGGAFVVDIEPRRDERGFFARTFCIQEFAAHGIELSFAQTSVSFNPRSGTLRGMHYQAGPHAEDKLIRCTAGAVFDVIVDLRRESPTYRRWIGVELSAANRRAILVPKGFAHGFLSLTDDAELLYMMSVAQAPEFAHGFRWDDPAIGIAWPSAPSVMSARDAAYPAFNGA